MGPQSGPGSEGSKGVQRVVVAADAAVFIKKGARLRRGLCSRVVFASLRGGDGPSGRGWWYRPLGAQRTHFALCELDL